MCVHLLMGTGLHKHTVARCHSAVPLPSSLGKLHVGSPKGGSGHPPPTPRPPAHSAWDQGALSSAVCFPWQHTKTILLQIGARSLEVSKCLSDCLSHLGASSTFAYSCLSAELLLDSPVRIFKCLPVEIKGAVSSTPSPEGTGKKPQH